MDELKAKYDKISIPAPARGRTFGVAKQLTQRINFNSRPREGANRCPPASSRLGPYFNSRPREGAN